jgi:NAD(P)-dependent dehydrogenase (short-subunit alcohol dehydrogenase family)
MNNSRKPEIGMFLVATVCLFTVIAAPCGATSHTETTGDEPVAQKSVLVTGASSGIGLKITEVLAARGVHVWAGARKQADLDRLDAMENVSSVKLDVTIQSEIDAAVKKIGKDPRGLYGLVNNAGVAVVAPLIEVDEDDFHFQQNVNVYGPYRITKAFAPLIIESKGRITTIGSISGILSGTLFGPYSMSKHSMEAFADSLAREMARFDVKVSIVEPGNYKSQIGQSVKKRMEARGVDYSDSPFKEEMDRMMARVNEEDPDEKEPDEVAEAVYHALFDDDPKMRYMVVPYERQAEITIKRAIQEMVELNQDQPYTYDRDTLVKMLDEALAALEE